jgi:hypothetical protein
MPIIIRQVINKTESILITVFGEKELFNLNIGSECPVYAIKDKCRTHDYPDRFIKIGHIGIKYKKTANANIEDYHKYRKNC